MKNLTIIDSYDYVVDLIENIADILNHSLSMFGKYSVSNDEICNIIIKNISQKIKDETIDSFKPITNDLLMKKKDIIKTRKLAIEMDEDLINSVNNAISIILANGYKKIPSRTMFFRESLRVFYNMLHSLDYEPKINPIDYFDLMFLNKLLGYDTLFGVDTYIQPPTHSTPIYHEFVYNLYTNPIVYKFILEHKEEVKILIDPTAAIQKKGSMSIKEMQAYTNPAYAIDEDCKNIENKLLSHIKAEDKEDGKVRFVLHKDIKDIWIEIPKNVLNNLISNIHVDYLHIGNKVKFFFLTSFINKELFRITHNIWKSRGNITLGDIGPYYMNSIVSLSDIPLVWYEIEYIENGEFSTKEKKELTNTLLDITTMKIQERATPKTNFLDVMLINYLFLQYIDFYPFMADFAHTKKELKITYE